MIDQHGIRKDTFRCPILIKIDQILNILRYFVPHGTLGSEKVKDVSGVRPSVKADRNICCLTTDCCHMIGLFKVLTNAKKCDFFKEIKLNFLRQHELSKFF